MITFSGDRCFHKADLCELFHSVGWDTDTPPDVLLTAMLNSTHIVTAWDGGKLVGVIRSMDDSVWSANIDCLVVKKDYQRQGIGTGLIRELLVQLSGIMCITVCPNDPENVGLYTRCGFELIRDGKLLQLYS